MTLSINPLAKLTTKVNSSVAADLAAAAAKANGALQVAGSLQDKLALDAKIGQLSGGLNSGLSQAAAGANVATALGGAQTAMNTGLGKVIQSPVGSGPLVGGNALGNLAGGLTNAAESIGTIGDVFGGVASTIGDTVGDISGALTKLTGGDLAGGFKDIAGALGRTAGSLNDILSLKRGANLPPGGELFTSSGEKIKLNPSAENDWRVRISCAWNIFNSDIFSVLEKTGGVVWPVLPTMEIRTTANYSELAPVHNNYPFLSYKNSQVDAINISGDFICETERDAAYWIAATTFFRTVTKMFYGQGANAGNPPPVCSLNGYGSMMFSNTPIVVKSFSVSMPNDVNYIKVSPNLTNSERPTWVPIKSNISVEVQPIYNRADMRQFSLTEYANGQMANKGGVGYF
jgi:hypothetical protein